MPFLKKIEKNRDEKGLTLIEVVASLFILTLVAVGVLSAFSTSGVWIGSARKSTVASGYAATIVDVVREHSIELNNVTLSPDYQDVDNNTDDDTFVMDIGTKSVNIDAPRGMQAAVTVRKHDDSTYYDTSGGGNPQVGGKDVYFYDNLYEMDVDISWNGGSRDYNMSTIIGAR